MIDVSELDTLRFGMPSARADNITVDDMPALDEFCKKHGIKFLIARCSAARLDVAQALEERGCRLMDTLLWFQFRFDKTPLVPRDTHVIREIRPGEEIAVQDISREAFRNYEGGHYHSDPRIDRAVCAEIYADWAHKSCLSKKVADHVLVSESGGEVTGFITIKKNGDLPLAVVRPDAQKQGLYTALVTTALKFVKDTGVERGRVSTQLSNVAVQKACQRIGLEPLEAAYTFHKWF
ncbi:MAG: GNAT family N-acetyltransferase [Alphaproteobacteria bacterium]